MTEHIEGINPSTGIRVSAGLIFKGVGANKLRHPGLAQRDNRENRLPLDPDPDLGFVVERTVDATHVKIDQHTINLPAFRA